jgi:hypothetical protein
MRVGTSILHFEFITLGRRMRRAYMLLILI